MIPPSYIFKNIYHQHWEEPAEVAAVTPERSRDGLLLPVVAMIHALFAGRRRTGSRQRLGAHVYQ